MSAVLHADWPAPPGVHAFTTLRHGAGSSSPPFDHFNMGNKYAADGDDVQTVERNRTQLVELCRLPSTPHWLKQVHGTGVLRIDAFAPSLAKAGEGWGGVASSPVELSRPQSNSFQSRIGYGADSPPAVARAGAVPKEPVADAATTSRAGVVLAILTADCLPVILANRDGDEIGAAHAGWRGLAAGMLERTVASMHSPAENLIAWLGPAAGPDAYEIGDEVHAAFVSRDPRAATAFVSTREGHWRVDLYALARQRLAAIGVSDVYGGGLCTISDTQRFYSHRRDARTGRMATLVWMEG